MCRVVAVRGGGVEFPACVMVREELGPSIFARALRRPMQTDEVQATPISVFVKRDEVGARQESAGKKLIRESLWVGSGLCLCGIFLLT